MSKSQSYPHLHPNIVVKEAIRNYVLAFPLYQKFIRKHKLNYDAKRQAVLYCCFLAKEAEKETVARDERLGFDSGYVNAVITDALTESAREAKEKAKEKALDYLIHGDQSQYDKKAGLVLPDYLTVIDCDQL